MNNKNNPNLTESAKKLRKNMTREERHLWHDFLKNLPVTVNRQKVLGRYIADFYCASAHLVIELDGSQHCEKEHIRKDEIRDAYFKSWGIKVLRFPNCDVNKNFEGVCQKILEEITTSSVTS